MKQMIRDYMKTQFDDDQETIDAIYEEYKSSMVEKLGEILAALPSGDCAKLQKLAHSLKGTSSMVGDMEINAVAVKLDLAGKASDYETFKSLVPAFQQLVEALD